MTTLNPKPLYMRALDPESRRACKPRGLVKLLRDLPLLRLKVLDLVLCRRRRFRMEGLG